MASVEITFSVQGYVRQRVEVTNPDYTPAQVVSLLNEGKALPMMHEGGRVCLYNEEGDEVLLGFVRSIDPFLDYDEFVLGENGEEGDK